MSVAVVVAEFLAPTGRDGEPPTPASVSFAIRDDDASTPVWEQVERVARLVPPHAVWTVRPDTEDTRGD